MPAGVISPSRLLYSAVQNLNTCDGKGKMMSAYHTLHATVRVEVLPSDAGLTVEELFLKYRPELESALYDEDSREFSIVKLELVAPELDRGPGGPFPRLDSEQNSQEGKVMGILATFVCAELTDLGGFDDE